MYLLHLTLTTVTAFFFLFFLTTSTLTHLQYIQSSAARILTYSKQSAHITSILFNLHWLPVLYKIIL